MSAAKDVRRFTDKDAFIHAAADFIRAAILEKTSRKERFSLALSGGSTPAPVYQALAGSADPKDVFPWPWVHLFFSDERMVPPDDERSNFRMAADALFSDASIPAENIHRMPGELLSAEQAALDYEDEVRGFFKSGRCEIPRFDLILLGMGPDGHTASLFPQSPVLGETRKLVAAAPVPPLSPQVPRLTFTLPLVNAARRVLFLVSSKGKEEALAAALSPLSQASPPAGMVNPASPAVWMILDPAP